MQDALKYQKWEIGKRARITNCDKTFEDAMEIPSITDGFPVVLIGESAFYKRAGIEESLQRTDAKMTKSDVSPGILLFLKVSFLFLKIFDFDDLKQSNHTIDPKIALIVYEGSYERFLRGSMESRERP